MPNIQHIKEKDAVLVPLKDWEKMQKELARLRKKVNKEKILRELRNTIIEIEEDIKRPEGERRICKTADEFLLELKNEQ
jgi:hypothetical protein